MLIPTLIMAAIALILLALAYQKGDGRHLVGLKSGAVMFIEIIPLLVCAFIIAGMVQVLLPKDMMSQWAGEDSGCRGLLLGTVAGAFTPGGPYVSLPIVAGFIKAGAGTGTMVAFLTSWSLIAVVRLPMELGLLGWRFTIIRLLSILIFPPIAGWIANLLVKVIR